MDSRAMLAIAGILLALATICGAFGAHALHDRLTAERLAIYETAVRYQFYHSLGLLLLGVLARISNTITLRWAAGLILSGILLFCGSIYALSFGAPRILGAFTPLGGVAFVAGWFVFAVGLLRH